MHLQELLIRYGLIAVLIGSAIEGDFSLILAGVVSHLGIFPFPSAIAAGTVGSLIGDTAWYGLGRFRGPRFREGKLYARVGPTIERLAQRLGPWELLAARFVYGTKAASMVFWGLHGLSLPPLPADRRVGCAIGALVFTGLGYLVSGSATALLGQGEAGAAVAAGSADGGSGDRVHHPSDRQARAPSRRERDTRRVGR